MFYHFIHVSSSKFALADFNLAKPCTKNYRFNTSIANSFYFVTLRYNHNI